MPDKEEKKVDPAVHYESHAPVVPKSKCGAVHKDQNAVCLLDKGHKNHHEAEWGSSGPHPTRFRWPQ